ncbi:MAG: ribonuclease III [Pseudomonadota bacterium]
MTAARRKLCRALGYSFDSADLLDTALTHRSAGSHNNERLEFLGDAALGFVIADALFERVPDATEGDLSRLRASLVKRDTLAQLAIDLELGEHLAMGGGELKSGGFRRKSVLADAFEAVLGAVYLDGGYRSVRDLIERLFAERLANLPDANALKDPKTRLQELLQARGLETPSYTVTATSGSEHAREFTVTCEVTSLQATASGVGTSRRRAEQQAAQRLVASLAANEGEGA